MLAEVLQAVESAATSAGRNELEQRLEALEKLVGHPAIVQEPEVQAGEEPEDAVAEPDGDAPVVVATPPTIIPATGIYLHIENLLCPFVEQQRLRWDLKEWAMLPGWLVEIATARLYGKRVITERYGNGELQSSAANYGSTIWVLYAERDPNARQATTYNRTIAASGYSGEATCAVTYHSTGEDRYYTILPGGVQLMMASFLHPLTLVAGTVYSGRLGSESQDARLQTVLNTCPDVVHVSDLTAAKIAAIPTLLTKGSKALNLLDVALLKIDVIPNL
jgi:hypothetical protein